MASRYADAWAYAIGAFFGGVAGAFIASFNAGAFPSQFSFNISVFLLCMVILGGMGSIWGVVVAGARRQRPAPGLPGSCRCARCLRISCGSSLPPVGGMIGGGRAAENIMAIHVNAQPG